MIGPTFNRARRPVQCGAAFALVCCAAAASAQDFPSKPIRFVDGFPPGGAVDVVMRLVAPKLSALLGQPIVLENRPGATGTIAAAFVAKSPPDGYILLTGLSSTVAISPGLYGTHLPYDSLRDLIAVAQVVTYTNMLVLHPSVPAATVEELIALAKARPNKLSYGSGGNGTSNHLAGELFRMMAKVEITHVPYKGGGAAVIAQIGGEVDMQFATLPSVMSYVRSGRLRGIAVTSLKRSSAVPEMPTVNESGLPGFEVVSWSGLLAPAGTPREVVMKLNNAVNETLRAPDVRQRIAEQALEVATGTPDQFAALIRKDSERWAKVIKAVGAKVD